VVRVIALFSGGLDSLLAVELIRRQGIDVLCLTLTTPFFNARKAQNTIRQINLPHVIEDISVEHLEMLKSPRYGYGKNLNPCIDCHTLMLKIAGRKMKETGSDFIITGEVLGQRPMSQNKQSLRLVAKNSGYPDYILRPLSARLLDPIKAEKEHLVDRTRLLSIQGRGRKDQIKLAADFNILKYDPPAGGCLLTEPTFSRRLRDLLSYQDTRNIRDYELLKYGRHFRVNENLKIIVGRNNADNEALRQLAVSDDLVLNMSKFPGPLVLVPFADPTVKQIAASLCVRYSDAPDNVEAEVACTFQGISEEIVSQAAKKEDCAKWIL